MSLLISEKGTSDICWDAQKSREKKDSWEAPRNNIYTSEANINSFRAESHTDTIYPKWTLWTRTNGKDKSLETCWLIYRRDVFEKDWFFNVRLRYKEFTWQSQNVLLIFHHTVPICWFQHLSNSCCCQGKILQLTAQHTSFRKKLILWLKSHFNTSP